MKKIISVIAAILSLAGAPFARADGLALSHALVGSPLDYVVQEGDSLLSIAGRFGESADEIARNNGIDYSAPIAPGRVLKIENLHVLPETLDNGVLINVPQRLLYFFRGRTLAGAFPVGLGRPGWPTPQGNFSVAFLARNPTWIVPPPIQEEMRRAGETVLTEVPPGPANPLGKYWIGLSVPGYGIHGTNAPSSVYAFRSHGCIRLQPEDIRALFPQVRVGDPIRIIYTPVLLAVLGDGRIYLEVNPDIYGKGANALQVLTKLAQAGQLANRIDWARAAQVIEQQAGLAREISLRAGGHEG